MAWKHFLICLSRLLFIAKNIVGAHSVIGMGLTGTRVKRDVGPQGIAALSFPLDCHFRSLSKYEKLSLREYKSKC